jgi:hypothetical protein
MKRIFICCRYAGDTARNEAVVERLYRKAVEGDFLRIGLLP